jgi:hypothetical protein
MTKIEEVKAEIKKLEEKLASLEAEELKSPAEKAYYAVWNKYPGDKPWNTTESWKWLGFQSGYDAARAEKETEQKPVQQPERDIAVAVPKAHRFSLRELIYDAFDEGCDSPEELTSRIEKWLPCKAIPVHFGWHSGYNACIADIKRKLR